MKRCMALVVLAAVGCGGGGKDVAGNRATRPVSSEPSSRIAARVSNRAMQQEANQEKSTPARPGKKYKLSAVVDHVQFDRGCGLLSFLVQFYVLGEEPQNVYLVSNNLSFPYFGSTGKSMYHILQVTQDRGTWTFDLSWPVPLAKNLGPDDAGIEGRLFPVMEIGEREYLFYSFQFPILLDSRYADVKMDTAPDAVFAWELIRAPRAKVRMRLKFGYGYEPVSEFVRREQGPNGSRPELFERIVRDWQTIVLTEPVTVDFSQDPVTVEFPETTQE